MFWAFLSELRGILDAYPQVRATVMAADAEVRQIWQLDQDVPLPHACKAAEGRRSGRSSGRWRRWD
jgi:predicted metal-dependent peptidase